MTLKNGTVYSGVFDKGVFLNNYCRRTYRIGDLKQYNTILFEGRLLYIKGRAANNKRVSEVVLSWNNSTVSPDLQVQLIREDNKSFNIYSGFVETNNAVRTVEIKSTYGYHHSKKSANVAVNTTTKT